MSQQLEQLKRFSDRDHLKGLMLQYTLVCRRYKDGDKTIAHFNITDGFIHTMISRSQYDTILKQAEKHERYEVGVEIYPQPTGQSDIDGWQENMELLSTMFHHIFIRPEYLDTIFEDYSNDRRITFINKKKEEHNAL